MAKIFLHTREQGQEMFVNKVYDLPHLPRLGEYVVLSSGDETWYEVKLVVHFPFDSEFEAEVFAVGLNHLDVLRQA